MTSDRIRRIQRALASKGFNPGAIDGVLGRRTEAAIIAFKKSIGYRARPYVGPLTEAALLDGRVDAAPSKLTLGKRSDGAPAWLRVARSYLGLAEYPGNRHNPKILEWWTKLRLPFADDETPWCAAFVCGVLEECGFRSTRSAAARSYNRTGWGAVLNGPAVGAIVVFWRKSRKGAYGHIGFVSGRDQHGNLMVCGGNQGNRVSILPFDRGRVLSYHWPKAVPLPAVTEFSGLPVVNSNGVLSKNEA